MQQCAGACSLVGRFGYSDLKEAAHMEAYVLCMGLECRGFAYWTQTDPSSRLAGNAQFANELKWWGLMVGLRGRI